jgi:hypothetical protein
MGRVTNANDGSTSIWRLVTWAFLAAGLPAFFGFLGFLLSRSAPSELPAVSALEGMGDAAQLDRQIEALLVTGEKVLAGDRIMLGLLSASVILGVLASLALTIRAIHRHVKSRGTTTPSTKAVIGYSALLLVPALANCGVHLEKGAVLESGGIYRLIGNENTRPGTPIPGEVVVVDLPTTLQSVFTYCQVKDFTLDYARAVLADRQVLELPVDNPRTIGSGSLPDGSDLILVEETIGPAVLLELSDNEELEGAIVSLAGTGHVEIAKRVGRKYALEVVPFSATTEFRVSRANELAFATSYEDLGSWTMGCGVLAAIAALAFFFMNLELASGDLVVETDGDAVATVTPGGLGSQNSVAHDPTKADNPKVGTETPVVQAASTQSGYPSREIWQCTKCSCNLVTGPEAPTCTYCGEARPNSGWRLRE